MSEIANLTILRLIKVIDETITKFSERYEKVIYEMDNIKNEILVQSVLAREFIKDMNSETKKENEYYNIDNNYWLNHFKKKSKLFPSSVNTSELLRNRSSSALKQRKPQNDSGEYRQNGKIDNIVSNNNGGISCNETKIKREEIINILKEIQKDTKILYGKKTQKINSYKGDTKQYKTDIVIDSNITITIVSKDPHMFKTKKDSNKQLTQRKSSTIDNSVIQLQEYDFKEDLISDKKEEKKEKEAQENQVFEKRKDEIIQKEKNSKIKGNDSIQSPKKKAIALPPIKKEFSSNKIEALFLIFKRQFFSLNESIPFLLIRKELSEKVNKNQIIENIIQNYQLKLSSISTSVLLSDKKLLDKIIKYPTKKAKNEISNINSSKEKEMINNDTYANKELCRLLCLTLGIEAENSKSTKELYDKLFKKLNVNSIKTLFLDKIYKRIYMDCNNNKKILSMIDSIRIYFKKPPIVYVENTLNEIYDFISNISNLSSSNIPRLKNSLLTTRYEKIISQLTKKIKKE